MLQRKVLPVAVAMACAAGVGGVVHANEAPAPQSVERIVVTASPFSRDDLETAQPASVVGSDELRRERSTNLGDTLAKQAGVHSTSFGPGSGRPVIRGQGGARVQVAENGVGTMDVSTLSPDHAVTVESLHAEQVEILRGPATLMYGSGAISGMVNVVSHRIPQYAIPRLRGTAELRLADRATGERTGAFDLDAGDGSVGFHFDAFSRRTDDYRIPGRQNPNAPESGDRKVPNSAVDAKGAAVGSSWVFSSGYVGASLQTMENQYGIPGEEGTRIDMKQDRVDIAGEMERPAAGLAKLKFRVAHNDYRHNEIEGSGAIGTRFKNNASEGRVELTHLPIGGFRGVVGMQWQNRHFSALGEEAVVPATRQRSLAAFLVEELPLDAWRFDFGLRIEDERFRPDDGLPSRRFRPTTVSAGAVWKFAPDLSLAATVTQAQRSPALEELYSHGPHLATASYEIGDPGLRKEVSRNFDLSLRSEKGALKWKAGIFSNQVRNYIYAASVDQDGDGIADRVDEEGELTPDGPLLLQQFTQATARFHGFEAEVAYRPTDGLQFRAFADAVRGRLDGGGNLPRMAPRRLGLEVGYRFAEWKAQLSALRVERQNKLAALETPTSGYTRLDGEISYRLKTGEHQTWTLFLQGKNLLNRDIRVHTSYLKDWAPLPGRSAVLGVRASF